MSIRSNDEIMASLITYLKENTSIVSQLSSIDEIRESNWQGDVFSYPNVRVRVIENTPIANGCSCKATVGVQTFSEEKSSKEAALISGIIGKEMRDASFTREGVTMVMRLTNLTPALRISTTVWRSEALFSVIIS